MTDQFPTTDDIASVFTAVAVHFTEVHPAEALHPDSLLVTISAGTYKLIGRTLDGRSIVLSRAVAQTAPDVPDGATRGEYAALLVDAIPGLDRFEDDGAGLWAAGPVVPTLPRPRTEPGPGPRTKPGRARIPDQPKQLEA
ncbi:hypothetical protein DDQ41_15145 [Streptomyces spongiicola]|uniref:Uncharacterized protein n=1 Tax=Streptomyces spongiicola TaxID=1690221 RepID=A0ABM6V7M3_9ACTN|nr:hypothetical protein [Streptomyces spongiicola]AWK10010.1 hypothetical protein DDQ41_15145 [Streptomyces spongiicola]